MAPRVEDDHSDEEESGRRHKKSRFSNAGASLVSVLPAPQSTIKKSEAVAATRTREFDQIFAKKAQTGMISQTIKVPNVNTVRFEAEQKKANMINKFLKKDVEEPKNEPKVILLSFLVFIVCMKGSFKTALTLKLRHSVRWSVFKAIRAKTKRSSSSFSSKKKNFLFVRYFIYLFNFDFVLNNDPKNIKLKEMVLRISISSNAIEVPSCDQTRIFLQLLF